MKNTAEQKAIEAITEASDMLDDGWQVVGGRQAATFTGGPYTRFGAFTSIRDRDDGRYWPHYETELDLKRIRANARMLSTFTSVTLGVQQALEVYEMGGHWEYEAVAVEGASPPTGLLDAVNKVIHCNLERNSFVGDLDREIHRHTSEDGEAMIAIYHAGGGECDWRRIESDSLTEPLNPNRINQWLGSDKASWTFGVHTQFDARQKRIDHTRHIGYHIVHDDAGTNWDYLPSWNQTSIESLRGKAGVLLRRNVPRSAKRGVSDYLPIQVDLERESKVVAGLSVGAAILSSIPWWEKSAKGTTKDAAQASVSNALDGLSRAMARSRGADGGYQIHKPGTVKHIDGGKEIEVGPMGSLRQPIYIEVCEHLKSRIGARFLMPYYMVSGDTSHSNFASTLVGESPFVKARQSAQDRLISDFQRLNMRSLKIALDYGRFSRWVKSWKDFVSLVKVSIVGPEVATRDKAELVFQMNSMFDRQMIDANEYRTAFDYDPKDELDGKTGLGGDSGGMVGGGGRVGGGIPQPPKAAAAISAAMESAGTLEEAKALFAESRSER